MMEVCSLAVDVPGHAEGTRIGDFYLEYVVELILPQTPDAAPGSYNIATGTTNDFGAEVNTGTPLSYENFIPGNLPLETTVVGGLNVMKALLKGYYAIRSSVSVTPTIASAAGTTNNIRNGFQKSTDNGVSWTHLPDYVDEFVNATDVLNSVQAVVESNVQMEPGDLVRSYVSNLPNSVCPSMFSAGLLSVRSNM
jgi:hypothetical protein